MPLKKNQFYWESDVGQYSEFPRKVTYINEEHGVPTMKKLNEQILYEFSPHYIYVWYNSTCYLGDIILDEIYSKLKKIVKSRNPRLFMKKYASLENEHKKEAAIIELYGMIEEIHLSANEQMITKIVLPETKIERPVIRSNNIYFRHHLSPKKRKNREGGEAVKVYWKGIRVRTFKKNPENKDEPVELKVASFYSKHTYNVGYLCISGEQRT